MSSPDFAISNVQCQYDIGSEMDPYAEPREEPTEDHTYGVRNFEPPAFFIQQTNPLHPTKIAIPRSFENPLPSRPKLPELRPKIMTIGPMYPSVNVIDGRDQPPASTRIRRSEVVLRQAADCVSRGLTFQTVSEQFNIPISTIRFFMARKGILPQRRRGRSTNLVPPSVSPEPPYHMQHFKLPAIVGLKTEADDSNETTT